MGVRHAGVARAARHRDRAAINAWAEQVTGQGRWTHDLASGALAVSPGLRALLGWRSGAAIRLAQLRDAIHPDDRPVADAWLRRAAGSEPPGVPAIFRLQRRGPGPSSLMARAMLLAPTGRRRVVGAVHDVSAWPASWDDGAAVYRGMFEHSLCGIFQSTPEGRYITVNAALARIYGYGSPAELRAALTDIGGQLYVDPGRRDDFVRQMRAHGAVADFESQVYRGDGRIIWISETCREVRDASGALLYYEGMVVDVTRRRHVEDELREAHDAAESAIRAKDDFLATMSHELRTPLNAIIGFSESMQRELLGPIGQPIYRDYSGLILDSGRHLLAMISDILDIVHMDSGRLALQDDIVELGALAGEIVRALARQIAAAGVTVTQDVPADLRLRGEERRLHRVLMNLVGNAVKFTPAGGTVAVAAGRLDDGRTRIVVRDTGIGIAADDLARVREPFQQVESALNRRHDGAGLGLAITDRLVRLHGGTLDLASRPGEGTVATITLPAERAVIVWRGTPPRDA